MGFEIPLDVDYCDHPKVQKLIAKLGKQADVYPIRLWTWAAKYAKDGVIDGGPAVVEHAVRWTGEAGKCHSALVSAGFLDRDGKTIHDWMEHAGRKLASYETKKKRERDKYRKTILPNSAGRPPAETGRSAAEKDDSAADPIYTGNDTVNETKTDTHGNGEHPPDDIFLAQEFAMDGGEGCAPSAVKRARVVMADLLAAGMTRDELFAEIKRPGRMKSEHPGEFRRRFETTKKGPNSERKHAKPDPGEYRPEAS